MDSQKCEFSNLDNASEVVKPSGVTKIFESTIENEGRIKSDKNTIGPEITAAETNLNHLCDINFSKIREVVDRCVYKDCDMIENEILSPSKQEDVNISEIGTGFEEENVDINKDINCTTDKITNTSQEITVENVNTTDNCTSPVIKKIKSTIQSPNASLQEVVDKVNKLDLFENPVAKNNISSVILKNQTSSLRNLLMYHSESSDNEDEDFEANWQLHVFPSSSSSSGSESDSQECLEISEDDDNSAFVLPNNKNSQKKVNKQIFEAIDPPADLSNIQIDYNNELFSHIGHITNFINTTVTIETTANTDSYDLETILFIDDKTLKRPLGAICDVLGPVHQPVYCVQLHDAKEIETYSLKEGMKVYSAPKSVYTKYIFLKDLLRMKGTDASWIGDEEAPSDEIDSSGDEFDKEMQSSRKRAHNNSLERHKQFENAKNRSNIIKNQVANMFDKIRAKPKAQNIHMFPHGFNPNVPPPNMLQSAQSISRVAPLPPPHQSTFNHPRHNRRFQNVPQFRAPNGLFTNNVGYHNAAGPSHQNHYHY